ncbi:MAG TPA: hypothetical protein VGK32_04700 [Vicinamibacterales bacterium]
MTVHRAVLPFIAVVLILCGRPAAQEPKKAATAPPKPVNAFEVTRFETHKASDPRLLDFDGELTFDDASKKLTFDAGRRARDRAFEGTYDQVRRVIFDVSTTRRGGFWDKLGGVAGGILSDITVANYWMCIEIAAPDGSPKMYVVEVGKDDSKAVIEKAKATFGDRVTMAEFKAGQEIGIDKLKDRDSKHNFEYGELTNHPLPELKPDKGLIVVVCPLEAGKKHAEPLEFQRKLHANDRVMLVNKAGTYGFFYLDPGEYLVVDQIGKRTSGLQVSVEAGKGYYLLQDQTSALAHLSQHSREYVTHELTGAIPGVWSRKPDKK